MTMIAIYKNTENQLVTLTEPIAGCWIHATDPTHEEIAWLEKLGIPTDYITYPLDLDERARTERENGELLVVIRIPVFNGQVADVPYTSIPLGIILTDQYLLTICKRQNEIIQEFASGRMRELKTGKRQRFLLRLLLSAATRYLAFLREINRAVETLEDQLQLSTRNKEVLELLKYQKSLTYFTTALKSNELMMERLQRSQMFKTYPEDEDLLEDVITENQQAIEMTNISSNILSSMMDAFASIISNNLNSVMKFLASITIILSLPTMIASFLGMNVMLPIDNQHPVSFYLIILLALVTSLGAAYLFAKRDWL
jgi:magnesium transporter